MKNQVNQFEYRWSISNFLFYCVELGQSVESNSFIFGPGEWKLRYNITTYDHLQFTLNYLGKLESNNTGDNGTADPAVFIKLALLSRTGSELEYLSEKPYIQIKINRHLEYININKNIKLTLKMNCLIRFYLFSSHNFQSEISIFNQISI